MATARYLPEQGGTQIHVHELSQRLAATGLDVTVLTTALEEPFVRTSQDGLVQVVRVRAWPAGHDYHIAPALVREIHRRKADLVHCQGYHTFVAPIVMTTALLGRVPYVLTLHSGGHSSGLRRSLRPMQAKVLRPLVKRARAVIAVSEFEAQLFARRLRMPLEAFTVIPSGVELPPAEPVASPGRTPLVVCVGRIEKYKGHHRVVEALPELRRARPGIRVRIVGSGAFETKLRASAAKLGVTDSVEIEPIAADNRAEMTRVLQRASVVALLSDYESQGLAVQEALALSRPLVVSDGSALAELGSHTNVRVLDRRAGPDEIARVILELIDAPPARRDLTRVPTWDECAASVLRLYRRVLGAQR